MTVLSEVRFETTPAEGIVEHDYAKLFPMLDDAARVRLIDDIREHGVIEPIVFLGPAILDGRNRYYAARELGIAYPRVDYVGDDPLGFVIGRNLHRRHLTDKQRADVAAKIAALPKGANQHTAIAVPSIPAAAALMDVSVAAVERAKVVAEHAAPELKAAYDAGLVSPSAAAEVARLPADEQAKIVKDGTAKEVAKQQREARQAKNDEFQAKSKAALPPEVQAAEAAKTEAISARRQSAQSDLGAADRIAELEQANEFLEQRVAELEAKVKTFERLEPMYRDWIEGGWDRVVQAKDDTIAEIQRTATARISSESHEKVRNLNAMRGLAKKLDEAGLGKNAVLDLETGEFVNG